MKQLVIWDEQREYALRLMNNLNQCANGLFVALLVQNRDELVSVLGQGSTVYLLVAEELRAKLEEVREQLLENRCETQLHWMELTEQPEKEAYQLCRYHNTQYLYRQLVQGLFQTDKGEQEGLQVIGVFALQDTAETRRYAREQAASNREIFWEMTMCSDYEGELYPAEQLLFAIKMREETLKDTLSEYLVFVNQTRMISGLSQFLDGRQLVLEDYYWFFEQLSKAGCDKLYLYMDGSMLQDVTLFSRLDELQILYETGCDNRKRHLLGLFGLLGIPDEKQTIISL